MGQRRKARELAFQLLYSIDRGGRTLDDALAEIDLSDLSAPARKFAENVLKTAASDTGRIDGIIQDCSINWRVSRLLPTDRNILRIAVGELLSRTAPAPVVIDEAIEISKKFGSERSGNFVNGILDCARKKINEAGSV